MGQHYAQRRYPLWGAQVFPTAARLRACEKIVASEGKSRSARVQERFAGSETARKPRRGESQGGDEQPSVY